MGVTQLVFELLAVKAKIKGVLEGHTVAMVTYCVTKMETAFKLSDVSLQRIK